MHGQRLAAKRVKLVNPRREFFDATPAEVTTLLAEHAGDLLHFEDFPEALEYRQSMAHAYKGQARRSLGNCHPCQRAITS